MGLIYGYFLLLLYWLSKNYILTWSPKEAFGDQLSVAQILVAIGDRTILACADDLLPTTPK
jgi:hypothetical protein